MLFQNVWTVLPNIQLMKTYQKLTQQSMRILPTILLMVGFRFTQNVVFNTQKQCTNSSDLLLASDVPSFFSTFGTGNSVDLRLVDNIITKCRISLLFNENCSNNCRFTQGTKYRLLLSWMSRSLRGPLHSNHQAGTLGQLTIISLPLHSLLVAPSISAWYSRICRHLRTALSVWLSHVTNWPSHDLSNVKSSLKFI